MKLSRPLAILSPLALSACATLPPISTDHPAHPDAGTARFAPFSGTLSAENLDMTSTAMDPGMAPAMSHDHGGSEAAPEGAPKGEEQVTLFTCPMDPEIVLSAPGKCPKCGMRLKPKLAEARIDGNGDGHDHDE